MVWTQVEIAGSAINRIGFRKFDCRCQIRQNSALPMLKEKRLPEDRGKTENAAA